MGVPTANSSFADSSDEPKTKAWRVFRQSAKQMCHFDRRCDGRKANASPPIGLLGFGLAAALCADAGRALAQRQGGRVDRQSDPLLEADVVERRMAVASLGPKASSSRLPRGLAISSGARKRGAISFMDQHVTHARQPRIRKVTDLLCAKAK